MNSVAVVPVGVTEIREGLSSLRPYTPEQAAAVIDQVEAFAAAFLRRRVPAWPGAPTSFTCWPGGPAGGGLL